MSMNSIDSMNQQDEFDRAFQEFISCYRKIDVSNRPSKIRKMMETSGNDLVEIFQFANLQDPFNGNTTLDSCTCTSCPARKELEQLNSFYMEFLQQEQLQI